MKKLLLLISYFVVGVSYAQFNLDAPWLKEHSQRKNAKETTYKEFQRAFNAYWLDKDYNAKGSGYKPFKRWEYQYGFYLKADGSLTSKKEIWSAWEQKNALRAVYPDVSNWFSVGPLTHTDTDSWSPGQGRVNAIIVDPNVATTYYAGAPVGGIWKSTNSGVDWTPLSDHLPQIGVSGIAIDYANSDIIYIATGDDDAGDSYSVGVMKSTDGGLTWNSTGLDVTNSPSSMNDIYIHPTNSNILWVATNNGVYKSTNAGTTWTQTQAGNIKDIKLKPGDPNVIYAVSPDTFYKSTDGGDSFVTITSGLPTDAGRLVIDVTPANANYVYVFSVGNGEASVYRSDNSGTTFTTRIASITDFNTAQAWYDMALGVSDTNAEDVYVGCLNVWKSSNGGTSFTQINNWSTTTGPMGSRYTHADIHLLRAFNGNMFCGSDGGIYRSSDDGSTFEDLTSGLAIGQFYRVAVSPQTSANMVGGLQDNGGYAYSNASWKVYYGADGMDTAVSNTNPNLYYGFIQNGGGLYVSTDGGLSISEVIGAPETGNWVTPLKMDTAGNLYAGYTKVYQLVGSTFTEVTTTAFPKIIDYLEIDPSDVNIMYITLDKELYKSTNGGVSFDLIATFGTDITSVTVHSSKSNVLYVTTSGSDGKVYQSIDQGNDFIDITRNLPSEPKFIVKHQGGVNEHNPIYVGTSLGVYRLDDTNIDWQVFSNNLPNVPVRDIEVSSIDNNITIATYGRGVWRSTFPAYNPVTNDVGLLAVDRATSSLDCNDYVPSIIMKNNGATNLTSATINYTVDGTPYVYNWTGNLIPNEYETVTLNAVPSSGVGTHMLDVIITTVGDAYADNNQMSTLFNSNENVSTVRLFEYESATDNFIAIDNGTTGVWSRGIPTGGDLNTASSGTQVYGTNLSGDYPNNAESYLISRCYDLNDFVDPVLKFNMAYEIENNYDVMYMEYSTDGGGSWSTLGSASDPNWYNSNNAGCALCNGGQWTGADTTMKEYSYDLAALATEANIIFRFVFKSDYIYAYEGVVIDDFIIDGTLSLPEFTSEELAIYPNPSQGIFNVNINRSSSKLGLKVYDVLGKVIFTDMLDSFTGEYQLNLNHVATGVYLLDIQGDGKKSTKKLIVN